MDSWLIVNQMNMSGTHLNSADTSIENDGTISLAP